MTIHVTRYQQSRCQQRRPDPAISATASVVMAYAIAKEIVGHEGRRVTLASTVRFTTRWRSARNEP